jgi:hypothetical protein
MVQQTQVVDFLQVRACRAFACGGWAFLLQSVLHFSGTEEIEWN